MQPVPFDFTNFFSRLGFEHGVHGHISKDIEAHVLITHCYFDRLHWVVLWDETGGTDVEARLFFNLTDGAVEIILVLVDFAPRKTPICIAFPASDKHGAVHGMIHHDGAAYRYSRLVQKELIKGLLVVLLAERREQRTVLEYAEAEVAQLHVRQGRVQRPNKIFVEPVCFLNLKADAGDRL